VAIDERARLFGDPSDLLVAEAVWLFRRENGDWPMWEELIDELVEWKLGDRAEAETRVLEALRREEVLPKLRAVRQWSLVLTDDRADSIARRHMDLTMPRRSAEEVW
jgi:hypothetical protein